MAMSEPKPFASLSSGLLARKGAAKPAMRPQGYGQFGSGIEDLGWNDMGQAAHSDGVYPMSVDDIPEHVPSSIAALTPAGPARGGERVSNDEEEVQEDSPVEQQRAAITASFAPASEEPQEPAAVVQLSPRPRPVVASGHKAAFTLRLDAERHLKLRLASAIGRRSAQQIVTEALDNFLDTIPGIDNLAGQVPAKAGKR